MAKNCWPEGRVAGISVPLGGEGGGGEGGSLKHA